MKVRKKKVIYILLLTTILFISILHLTPKSFDEILQMDRYKITSISCVAYVSGVMSGGETFIDAYSLNSLSREDDSFHYINDVLFGSAYRSDFRNLIPITTTFISTGNYNKELVNIFLNWGNEENEKCFMILNGNYVIISIGETERYLRYHLTDSAIFEKIVSYVQENGKRFTNNL